MKLSKIKMKNFRQFYGQQEIAFSDDDEQNVTVVHAENGVGKTTLLNAVLWAMYGKTTTKFEQSDKIVNFAAKQEGSNFASVEVQFSHNHHEYVTLRTFDDSEARNKEKMRAFEVKDGNYVELQSPSAFVNRVIPRDIAKYFFFDGEHAETFAAENNKKEVNAAIRDILGCRLVETGISDLKSIVKKLNAEIGNIPGSSAAAALEEKRASATLRIEQGEKLIKEFENALETRTNQIQTIEKKLRESQGARNLQKVRDQKKRDLSDAKRQLSKIESEIAGWVGEHGVYVAAKKLADASLEFIEDTSARGIIPSPYNEEFVRGLLEANMCICDRPLKPQTPEFGAVMKLLENASTADLRRKIMRAQSRISALNEGAKGAPENLRKAYSAREEWNQKIALYEKELGEVSEKIRGLPEDQSRQQEEARVRLAREIEDINRKIGGARVSLEDDKKSVKRYENERDTILSKGKAAEALIKRRELANEVIEHLAEELREYEKSARSVMRKKVNTILEETSRKPFKANLAEDFSLTMKLEGTQGPAPKSGGENQLLSLGFIGALLEFSKERQGADGKTWVAGTVAPLVLDSPFGQLDPEYRKSTAEFIPKMAEQVILLLSRSQGDENVLDAIDDKIGAEYVLVSHSTGERGTKPEDRLEIHGTEFVRALYGQERNETIIKRVSRPGAVI